MIFRLVHMHLCTDPSLPPWERGLKYILEFIIFECIAVAPPVGAWIEIEIKNQTYIITSVAPPVGAWIEILQMLWQTKRSWSLPPWERGLKYSNAPVCEYVPGSLPPWERGLK